MNVSRIAILGVALLAGGGAFFLMISNAPRQQAVQVVQPATEKTSRVLVAGRDFQRGERFTAEDTKWVDWPERALSPAYLTEAGGATQESLVGAVVRTSLVSGEPIIETKIVRVKAGGVMSAVLGPGMRAITQRVSPDTAAGGFILPGDFVDILHTDGRGETSLRTRTIFENVRVLAVNAIYTDTPETPNIEGVNVTLEFSPPDAEQFITARSGGTISLALRSVHEPEGEAATQSKRSTDVTIIRYGRS